MSFWSTLFSGGAFKSIENIASEWIETDMESAEAKALMVKTLDPNGLMRREQSTKLLRLYSIYVMTMLLLIICEFFGVGDSEGMAAATGKIKELFLPITTMVGAIISASFGVNYANTKQGK
jgi:hypothetical protein